jgi:hypothetical protein
MPPNRAVIAGRARGFLPLSGVRPAPDRALRDGLAQTEFMRVVRCTQKVEWLGASVLRRPRLQASAATLLPQDAWLRRRWRNMICWECKTSDSGDCVAGSGSGTESHRPTAKNGDTSWPV